MFKKLNRKKGNKIKTGKVRKRSLLPKDPKKRKRLILIVGLLIIAITLGLVFGLYLLAIQPVEGTEGTEGSDKSEFIVKDYMTREEIELDMTLYVPITNMNDYEECYNIANFEADGDIVAEDSDDVSLDITQFNETNEDDDYTPIVWVKIHGTGNYQDQWFAVSTKYNAEYVLYMYPQSADVRYNIINESNRVDGLPTTNATYIISNIDFDGESDVCQASLFDLSVNTFIDYENIEDYTNNALARVTDTFAFIITANDTITNNATHLMNIDVSESFGYYVFTVVNKIYIVASGDQYFGGEDVEFDIEFGTNVSISSFGSGRITLPSLTATGLVERSVHTYSITV